MDQDISHEGITMINYLVAVPIRWEEGSERAVGQVRFPFWV